MHIGIPILVLLAAACSSPRALSEAEQLCIGAATCAGDAGTASVESAPVQSCVDDYRDDGGQPGSFVDCCQACASEDGGARLACEAHCGGWQECCPR